MELRAYTAGDAQATSLIFLRAVRETARAHYSPEQVAAWAADYGDLDSWAAARAAAHTQLDIIDGHVAGFTDLDDHRISSSKTSSVGMSKPATTLDG